MLPVEPIKTGTDWGALLAERSGETRDKIEWHLQQEIVPTDPMLTAAGELLAEAQGLEDGAGLPPV